MTHTHTHTHTDNQIIHSFRSFLSWYALLEAAENIAVSDICLKIAAMSDPFSHFLNKFYEIWRVFKDARLIVECHAGQACISLHHCLPSPPPHSPKSPRRRSPPSPSRVRRRLRRANARAAAAKASLASEQKDEDDVSVAGQEKGVQTDLYKTVDKSVQDDRQETHQAPPMHHTDIFNDQHYSQTLAAEQAGHHLAGRQQNGVGQHHRQVAVHVQSESDELNEALLHNSTSSDLGIPQLDGNTSQYLSQCNLCQRDLLTIDDHKWHFYTKHGREDCRLLRSMPT